MKKLLFSALAVTMALGMSAKTADELRIYINPGHGSWTPNDRPCTLVGHGEYSRTNTDTLSFFESNTNLQKGFAVLERMREYGLKFDPTLNQTGERHQIGAARDLSNNIIMSHVKCGPFHDDNGTANQLGTATPADLTYYNRNLSEIVAEVEANNIDYFISIHSNAATEGTSTNFPLFLYRGYDDGHEDEGVPADFQTICKDMAKSCWKYAYENPFMVWTNNSLTNMNIRGDINFYGSGSINTYGRKGYLGALKHCAPGFLVEGYFHTYQPARHRAMNWEVDHIEGDGYAHGLADYLGLQKEKTGAIYGIVRDQYTKFSDDAYKPNPKSDDLYLPLNGATVVLKKGDEVLATKVTDNYYNGAYVFRHLEPGTYTVTITHPDYLEEAVETVEVKAANTSYANPLFLVNKDWTPPTITYVNYPDSAANVKGLNAADEYNFKVEYADAELAELAGKNVRRAIVREGKIYVLAAKADNTEPAVLVYDGNTKELLANVSLEGLQGAILPVGDIQVTADGRLMGVNHTINQSDDSQCLNGEPRGRLDIFAWENDENGIPTGNPVILINHTTAGLWYRSDVGNTFAYTGTLADGQGYISAPTTGSSRNMRGVSFGFANGQSIGSTDMRPSTANVYSALEFGDDYRYITSPLDAKKFFVVGSKTGIKQFDFNNFVDKGFVEDATPAEVLPLGVSQMFRYAGHSYFVAPAMNDNGNVGLEMFDITDGLKNIREVATQNTEMEAAAATGAAAMAEVESVVDATSGRTTAAYIVMYALRDGKLTKLTTKGAKQPQNRKEFAYDLKGEQNEGMYTVTFKATGEAPEANLVLTPTEGEAIVLPIGAVQKGENTFSFETTEVNGLSQDAKYTWAVEIHSKAIPMSGEYFSEGNGLTVRGSVIPITDADYDSYGYTVVAHGKNQGIDVYDPTGAKVQTRMHTNHTLFQANTTNQSNPFRGDEREGMAVLGSWGDGACGIVKVNPLDATAQPEAMYAGTKQATGHYVYDGANLGGGIAGLTFVGKGENTRLYTFSEDHQGLNGSGATENSVVCYQIGSAWLIEKAPEVVGHKGLMANTNVDLVSYGDGYFAAQVRGAGNNTKGCPGFAYLNHDQVVFQSSDIEGLTNVNSGFAITNDGKVAAIGSTEGIHIADVTWNNNVPAMTINHTITGEGCGWQTMRFDAAGNLHVYSREKGGYHVYSISDAAPVATTPARAEYVVAGTTDVIENIIEENATAPVEYYNLNGVRVSGDNLPAGIYIRKQGNNSTKVLVK